MFEEYQNLTADQRNQLNEIYLETSQNLKAWEEFKDGPNQYDQPVPSLKPDGSPSLMTTVDNNSLYTGFQINDLAKADSRIENVLGKGEEANAIKKTVREEAWKKRFTDDPQKQMSQNRLDVTGEKREPGFDNSTTKTFDQVERSEKFESFVSKMNLYAENKNDIAPVKEKIQQEITNDKIGAFSAEGKTITEPDKD